jgi:tripeptide aminopeptidase
MIFAQTTNGFDGVLTEKSVLHRKRIHAGVFCPKKEKVMPFGIDDLAQLQRAAFARVDDVVALTQRICAVPAPTGDERRRADFIAALWKERGYTPEIDEISNVYVQRGQRPDAPFLLLLAHIDTVFPATTPLLVRREGNTVYGPGIGDNCVSVAAMMTALQILDEYDYQTSMNIVAVANVGEEGLGNLRGARAAVDRYVQRDLGAVLVIDGRLGNVVDAAVGSKRWRINVSGPGGHSYGSFGTPSAIHGLSKIIASIADIQVPQEPKTTFNVGLIEGGTSVNTIAAYASAVVDLRSTDVAALDLLAQRVHNIAASAVGPQLRVTIENLGERPAGHRPVHDPLTKLVEKTLRWLDIEPRRIASSTDANIPISLNIPSVCIGITYGDKAHTVEENIQVEPITRGLSQLLRLCGDIDVQTLNP